MSGRRFIFIIRVAGRRAVFRLRRDRQATDAACHQVFAPLSREGVGALNRWHLFRFLQFPHHVRQRDGRRVPFDPQANSSL